jgi:iron complex transport system substrate-binding protein
MGNIGTTRRDRQRASLVGAILIRHSGLAALVVAMAGAGIVVHRVAPVSMFRTHERPFAGYGDARVRTGQVSYPRQAIGADDTRVTIGAKPERIVSQAWAADEFLYTVVPPERIVGISESAYQDRISNVFELARRYRPVVANDPERVLRADPDLVLTPVEARSDVPGLLRAAGIPLYRIYTTFQTLRSIEEHIRLIGYLTGEDARAELEIVRFREAIERAAARKPAAAPAPRVLGLGGTYSYGSQTLMTDILRVLGAENVAATNGMVGYDRVTDEHIVRWNPEWIVAGADRGQVAAVRQRLLASPAIAATAAAEHGQILVLENNVFLPLSPFTAAFVDALSLAFYGERS